MKYFILIHDQITMAQASILHSVEQWFTPELEDLTDHFLGLIRYYHDAGELTDYQAKKLRQMVKDFPKVCRGGSE